MRSRSSLILFAALVASIYFTAKFYSASRDQTKSLESQSAVIDKLQQELDREKGRNQAQRKLEEQAIEQLKDQQRQARSNLEAIGQRLHSIQNASNDRNEAGAIQDKLNDQRGILLDLDQQLRVVRAKTSQISSEGNLAQGQNKVNQKLSDEELKNQIALQEQSIKNLQGQIADLRKRRYDFEAAHQADLLQSQVNDQKLGLQQLKNQRQTVTQQWEGQKSVSQLATQTRQQELKTSEEQLKQQISEQKALSQQLERQLQDAKQSKASQKATLAQLQSDYAQQKAQVEDLQGQITQHEARLKELQ